MKTIVTGPRVVEFVDRINGGTPDPCAIGIGLEQDGQIIAGAKYDNFNGASVCVHLAAVEGCRWMTREYLFACFDYPFRQLGVKKLLGLVDSSNTRARSFDEHIGYTVEAVIKDAAPGGTSSSTA